MGNPLISFVNLQSFLDIEDFCSILRSVFSTDRLFGEGLVFVEKKTLLCELYLNMFPLSS